jgi:hypothetical protein
MTSQRRIREIALMWINCGLSILYCVSLLRRSRSPPLAAFLPYRAPLATAGSAVGGMVAVRQGKQDRIGLRWIKDRFIRLTLAVPAGRQEKGR